MYTIRGERGAPRRLAAAGPLGLALGLALGLVACAAAVAPAWASPTSRRLAEPLLAKIGGPNPPGRVLLYENFSSGNLARWKADAGWKIVDRPDGGGKCAQVTSGTDFENLILKTPVPIVPGHPIGLFWRTRFVSGGSPLYMRIDFLGADGKAGQPYARQQTSQEGRGWTDNCVMISDWFPAYTRSIIVRFHQNPKVDTTSLLSDVRLVDLEPAVEGEVTARLKRLEATAAALPARLPGLPASPAADAWRREIEAQLPALRRELAAAAKAEPGSARMEAALARPALYLTRFTDAATGLAKGLVKTPGPKAAGALAPSLLAYSTTPTKSVKVLPDTAHLPGASLAGVRITACPGEYVSGSLVLWSPGGVKLCLPIASDLTGPGGTLPASCVDLKWVKCWYQAGTAPYGVAQDRSHKVLVPELLLNDDSLVRVDRRTQHEYLKLGFPTRPIYVPIDSPTPTKPAWGFAYKIADFPVKDSPTLLPANLPAGENKQVWITVKIPADAAPGVYSGAIELTSAGRPVGAVPFAVRVLPFKLPAPKTHYDLTQPYTGSLYYWGNLDPTGAGSIGYKLKTEQQFRAELKMMYDHNIVAPAMILSPDIVYHNEPLFRRYLRIMRETGMSGRPLYLADSGLIGSPSSPAALAALRQNVRRALGIAAQYGFTTIYFYGLDEATGPRLLAQRKAWQAVHEAGGKVFVSGFTNQFPAVGDLLDLFNRAGDPASEDIAAWHRVGHKVWNYANPQTPPEDQELYRRNYGLYDWRLNLDGDCTYCFMDSSGFQWDDFDDNTYRDHCLAYPTANGVVATLAIQGLRDALDDFRYATALLEAAKKADEGSPRARARARAARAWLDSIDTRNCDLDTVRREMVRRILELREGS